MKIAKKIKYILPILVLIITGCQGKQQVYSDDELKFSIKFPAGWEIINMKKYPSMEINKSIAFVAKYHEHKNQTFVPNVNLIITSNTDQTTINTICDTTIAEMSKIFTDFAVQKTRHPKIAGVPAISTTIRYTDLNGQKNMIQYVFIKNNNIYILTSTCETKDFSALEKTFHHISKSFKFID